MAGPAFQFYPGDWRKNSKLRRCTPAARGVWMDVLCVLHDSDEYGVVRWPLADLAMAAGAKLALLRELAEKGVLKGADAGAEPYVYRPKHAGQLGEPVTLVDPGNGPCWYCSRQVRDEWVRSRRGSQSRFTGTEGGTGSAPMHPPKVGFGDGIGSRHGDGPSSSSSASKASGSVEASRRGEGSLPREGGAQHAHKAPSPAAEACLALRAGGVHHVNPSHPDLLAAIAEGVTPDELRDAAAEAVQRGKPNLAYVVATVRGRRRDAAAAAAIAPGTEIVARAHGPPQSRASPPSKARQILQQLHEFSRDDDGHDSEMVSAGGDARAIQADLPGP